MAAGAGVGGSSNRNRTELVPFWIQIRGVPLYLSSEENVRKLAEKIGEDEEIEDPGKARGFLSVKVTVNTANPLINGCWLPIGKHGDTWIEFRYERLQDFCYRYGRIGHPNNECSFEPTKGSAAGYGDWTKVPPIRDFVETPRPLAVTSGERRRAGAVRVNPRLQQQQREENDEHVNRIEQRDENVNRTEASATQDLVAIRKEKGKRKR